MTTMIGTNKSAKSHLEILLGLYLVNPIPYITQLQQTTLKTKKNFINESMIIDESLKEL